jgi:hypothetical protein
MQSAGKTVVVPVIYIVRNTTTGDPEALHSLATVLTLLRVRLRARQTDLRIGQPPLRLT